jgi:hypothetical protein
MQASVPPYPIEARRRGTALATASVEGMKKLIILAVLLGLGLVAAQKLRSN